MSVSWYDGDGAREVCAHDVSKAASNAAARGDVSANRSDDGAAAALSRCGLLLTSARVMLQGVLDHALRASGWPAVCSSTSVSSGSDKGMMRTAMITDDDETASLRR